MGKVTMDRWFTLAIVGLVGVAAGFLGSLGMTAITGEDLKDVIAQRDQLQTDVAAFEVTVRDCQATEVDLKDQLEKATDMRVVWQTYYFNSQAFIGMMRASPGVRDYLLGDDFAENYDSDWFAPDDWFELFGGKWLVDELREQGMLTDEQLSETATEPVGWRKVVEWSIDGSRKTEPFKITTPCFRVTWTGDASVAVYDGDGRMIENMNGDNGGVSVVYQGQGLYYLAVDSFFGPSTIRVEQVGE